MNTLEQRVIELHPLPWKVHDLRTTPGANELLLEHMGIKWTEACTVIDRFEKPVMGPFSLDKATFITNTVNTAHLDPSACPGCGCMPGDGLTDGCKDRFGCGHWRSEYAVGSGLITKEKIA